MKRDFIFWCDRFFAAFAVILVGAVILSMMSAKHYVSTAPEESALHRSRDAAFEAARSAVAADPRYPRYRRLEPYILADLKTGRSLLTGMFVNDLQNAYRQADAEHPKEPMNVFFENASSDVTAWFSGKVDNASKKMDGIGAWFSAMSTPRK